MVQAEANLADSLLELDGAVMVGIIIRISETGFPAPGIGVQRRAFREGCSRRAAMPKVLIFPFYSARENLRCL